MVSSWSRYPGPRLGPGSTPRLGLSLVPGPGPVPGLDPDTGPVPGSGPSPGLGQSFDPGPGFPALVLENKTHPAN